ncbi:MAG: hypothetical protein ACOY0T_13435 [Myxococcota bacterium]
MIRRSFKIATVALLAVAGLVSSASAAKTEWAYLFDGASGNRYWDCVSRPLDAGGYGADSAGNTLCIASQYVTGSWKANTSGNCAGATKQRALLMGNFLVYCDSGYTGWTTQINCAKTLGTRLNSTGAACVQRTLRAYAQGTL